MKSNSYYTRALKATDRRYARVLERLGYSPRAKAAGSKAEANGLPHNPAHPLDHDQDGRPGGSTAAPPSEDLTALRQQYIDVVGKRPFPGWDAATLRARMEAHRAAEKRDEI